MQEQEQRHDLTFPSLPRSFRYSIALMAVFLAVLISLGILTEYSPSAFSAVLGTGLSLANVVGFALSWVGSHRRQNGSSSQPLQGRFPGWLLLVFSTALLFLSVGSTLFTYYYAHHIFYFPSWADAAILGAYPLLMFGVLYLPARSLQRKAHLRILLDSMMLIAALLTFSWYFLLGPLLLQETGGSLLAIVTTLAYPSFDLLVMSCIVVLMMFLPNKSLRLTASLLCVALVMYVLADSTHEYEALYGAARTLGWYSLGWTAGVFLLALAVQTMRWLPVHTITAQDSTPQPSSLQVTSMWRTLLPYGLVPAVLVLTLYVWETDRSSPLALGTYSCSLLLLVLIFLKQFIVLQEIHRLNRGLEQARHTLHENNVALQQANARLGSLATTDPLTELPNHRALIECLENEVSRARRYGHHLSILFFDGDHFKRVNDTYGHSVGDAVLQELGRRVRDSLRGGDTIGRYGGEEFMVLLPQTDLTQACEVAERMRLAIAAHPLVLGLVEGGINLTISIGVATFPTDGQTASEVVDRADQAMYWAKRLGRNQLRTALEAQQASQDSALTATIHNLERRNSQSLDGLSVEQWVRANQLTTIQSLMGLLDSRDQGISAHCYQVSDLAAAIAREMGMEQDAVFAVSTAGLLHDIGKIALPDLLLHKASALSANEWALIKQHPELGAQILEVSPYLHDLMPAVAHHHENWDGTGYPEGLGGENIPLAARILRVSEAYCAMMTTRAYQAQRSAESARYELERCSSTRFDPEVVQAALRMLLRLEAEAEAMNDDTTSLIS